MRSTQPAYARRVLSRLAFTSYTLRHSVGTGSRWKACRHCLVWSVLTTFDVKLTYTINPENRLTALLIEREEQLEQTYRHLFSVPGPRLSGHALVTHHGDKSGLTGTWICSKDPGHGRSCRHIQEARDVLRKLTGTDVAAIPSVGYSVPARTCESTN